MFNIFKKKKKIEPPPVKRGIEVKLQKEIQMDRRVYFFLYEDDRCMKSWQGHLAEPEKLKEVEQEACDYFDTVITERVQPKITTLKRAYVFDIFRQHID